MKNKERFQNTYLRLQLLSLITATGAKTTEEFTSVISHLEAMKEDIDYLIKSMEKLGEYDPEAEED